MKITVKNSGIFDRVLKKTRFSNCGEKFCLLERETTYRLRMAIDEKQVLTGDTKMRQLLSYHLKLATEF